MKINSTRINAFPRAAAPQQPPAPTPPQDRFHFHLDKDVLFAGAVGTVPVVGVAPNALAVYLRGKHDFRENVALAGVLSNLAGTASLAGSGVAALFGASFASYGLAAGAGMLAFSGATSAFNAM